jgi:hypothetical protein
MVQKKQIRTLLFLIGCIILLWLIYSLVESSYQAKTKTKDVRESFAGPLSVTDKPSVDTPAPGGVLPVSVENQREGKYVIEDDLMPGPPPSTVQFQIVPQSPPWRVPVHPEIPPAMSKGGEGLSVLIGQLKMDLPWVSPNFQEFKRSTINQWVEKTSDTLDWPRGVENWDWVPFPNDKKEVQRWRDTLWTRANWEPPIDEMKDNQAPRVKILPDAYWSRWANDWLNRWNEEMVRTLHDNIPENRRVRTLEYPFQYGRIWYIQGWTAEVNGGKKTRIMQYMGELVRPNAQVVYMMDWIVVGNPEEQKERPKISVAWIGSRPYDQVWMPNGIAGDEGTAESTTPASPPPQLLDWERVPAAMRRKSRRVGLTREGMNIGYQCFIPAPAADGKTKSHLLFAASKEDCENRLDFVGRPKPQGVWDRPCITDEDCLFFGGNDNYPNEFGRCLENGRCQFPLGMEPLGFRYFIPGAESEPYCYNCESREWKPNTELGKCCEEQKNNREKYPFLNSPDFAFRGDSPQRERHYIQTQCKVGSKGEMLFCGAETRGDPQVYPKLVYDRVYKRVPIPAAVQGLNLPNDNGQDLVPGQTNATFLNPTPLTAP